MWRQAPQPTAVQGESAAWLQALRGDGPQREEAAAQLHRMLVGASHVELLRRRAALSGSSESVEDLAVQSADNALAALLAKLDDFRFESRFTTWAYKFAVLEAAMLARRRAWQERELPTDPHARSLLGAPGRDVAHDAGVREQLRAVTRAIRTELSPHQREVLTSLVLEEVPIDVLAQRLTTTRGALYKTLHDARRKLRTVTGIESDG